MPTMSPTRPAGGVGLVDLHQLDPALPGEVLDVDHVDRRRQVRLEQLDRRQAQQRVHVLRRARCRWRGA